MHRYLSIAGFCALAALVFWFCSMIFVRDNFMTGIFAFALAGILIVIILPR